jgi:hypothetical protein
VSVRRVAAVVAAIAAVWLIAELYWIVTDTVVPWDSKNQFYTFFRFLAGTVHAGLSPFWNPYHYSGHPSVADPQSLIFAPAFLLYALFDGAPSLHAFDLIVFAHLLLGGVCIGAIGMRSGWPAAACVLAAAVFMFGGAAAGRLQHTGVILCYSLFPPALLLMQTAIKRRSLLAAVGFAVVAAVLVLGRNQVALLMCFVLAAMAMAEIAVAPRPFGYFVSRLPVFAVAAGVGLLLIAAPMLLTMQFAALSNRPAEVLGDALKGSLYPANLATLAVADIFGTHGDYWGPDGRTVAEVAFTDDSFNYMFIGAVPVVLLMWLGLAGGGALRRGRRLLFAIGILAVVYALGRYTPAFAFAFDWIPGVAKFRRPVDADFVLLAMLALLTGHLLSDYVREGSRAGRAGAALAAIATLAVIGSGIVFSAAHGHLAGALIAVAKSAPVFLVVVLVLALARSDEARARAALVVTTIAVAELLYWNIGFRLNAEPRWVYSVMEHPTGEDAATLRLVEEAIASRHAAGERPRVEFLGLGGPWENIGLVRGIEAINGYNPLRIGAYDKEVAPGESNWLVELRDFPPTFPGYDSPLARALGLEFLVLGRPIEQVPNLKQKPDAEVLKAGPDQWVYRLRHPLPRASFPAGSARIASWRPDQVTIETQGSEGGILTLHDPYYPGWVATVDGQPVPIVRAGLFRSVEVPAGAHRVIFRYAPFSPTNLLDALLTALHGRSSAQPQ